MGSITDAIASAFRDFVTDGVASSGIHEPLKAEVRALGPLIEAAIGNAGLGALVSVTKATKALLDADLAHPADTVALVYADAADANNDMYIKTGSSGAGAWTNTGAFHNIASGFTGLIDLKVTQTRSLINAGWLDSGALDGRLSLNNGWTAAKEALVRAIKFVRLSGTDPAKQYFIGIFQNTDSTDIIAIYPSDSTTAACFYNGPVTKSSTGLTQVKLTGPVVSAELYIDYRELAAFPGTIQNSSSPGPLWIAPETAETFIDRRVSTTENKALKLRNQFSNGGCDPNLLPPLIRAPLAGKLVPFKAPAAELAARGVAQSVSVGPEATDLVFLYADHPVDGAFAAQKYFFVSHYIYASNPEDFPLQIQAYSIHGDTLGSALTSTSGYVSVTANLRLYWRAGQLPNTPNMTAIRFGMGAKLAAAAEAGGFTARLHNSNIGINDVSLDDWLGDLASESGIARNVNAFADRITPYVAADGSLKGMTDASAVVTIADAIGTIRGVQQSGHVIRWVDDGIASRRSLDLRGLSALAGLGVNKIVFKPMLGQSLSIGTGGHPIVTSTTPWPGRAFMFNGGTRITQGDNFDNLSVRDLDDKQMLRLVPLIEQLPPGGLNFGETPGGGQAWVLGASGGMAANEVFVFASFGFGGLVIDALKKGTVPYRNLLRGVRRLKLLCDLAGMTLEVPAVDWMQGEGNYGTAGATYVATLLQLQSDIQSDIQAIIGGSGAVPLLIRQPSSWSANLPGYQMASSAAMLAVVDAAIANPTKLKMAGPQYSTGDYTDGVHKGAAGYRREGEYIGRATRDIRAAGPDPALYVNSVTNSGTTVTITFNASSQLVLDTSLVSDPGQYGLRLLAPDGTTTIALSDIAVLGPDKIVATAATALIAGQTYTVGIADTATVNQPAGPTTGPRCNVRDSSADAASTGPNLYRWALAQRKTFVAV